MPEEIRASLSLDPKDGGYVIKATDGTAVPSTLAIEDADGNIVGVYATLQPKARASTAVDGADALVTYTASVGVGNPATHYTLLIDTGSSNTWVGAGK